MTIHSDVAPHIAPGVIDYGINRYGLRQLRRRWSATGEPQGIVLILHGINEHSGRYEHVGRQLAAAGFHSVAYDHQGHGESAGIRSYVEGFDRYLDDVEDHMENCRALGLPVILLGHSMGGLIAAAYSVSDRPQPDLLILSAPALAADVPAWQRAWAPRLVRLLPSLFLPSRLDGTILSRDPAVGEDYNSDPLTITGSTVKLGNELFQAMDATTSSVHQLQRPTWVVHGSADRLCPASASECLEGLDNVTRVVAPGLEHEVFNEPEGPTYLAAAIEWIYANLAATATQ